MVCGGIYADVTCDSFLSFQPWQAPDQEGDGVDLPCDYVFYAPTICDGGHIVYNVTAIVTKMY